MKRAIIVVLIIAAIGAVAGAYYIRRNGTDVTVNTDTVTRGDIIDTVGATGALQAVTTVQVGSQVSGNISWLGVDFNSIVHQGQVIARIDPSIFQAQVAQAQANLVKSQADVVRFGSDVERSKVALTDAQQKYTRAKELASRNLLPQSELDAAKIAVDSAQAALQSSQAQLSSGRAQVTQAQASVNQSQVNLAHCVITAPIDGIVIQRSVDVGQTVAASLQSPTLFIIAADLTQMQVNASIDEADIGRIRPGQTVTFRVDAYPTDDFTGTVSQIRLQPVVVQNVTTYGTIINVPNRDLKLKPGMTANLKVQIARRSNVLRVPNAALRFRPTEDMFAALGQALPPEMQMAGRRGRGAPGAAGQPAGGARPAAPAAGGAPASPNPAGPAGGADRPGGGAAPDAGQGGDQGGDRRARMLERFKTMSADEQRQFLDRMKERGADTSAFEAARTAAAAPAADQAPQAETIDALFAPLPPTETTGRAWMYVNNALKPVRLRLGITDGTNTELLAGELQSGTELVTGIIMSGPVPTASRTNGNPLMGPQRRGRGR